jgi:hypothetical protein
MDLQHIDERWIINHAVALWNFMEGQDERDRLAAEREKRAEQRHKELLTALATFTSTIVKTLDGGFRALADALRR